MRVSWCFVAAISIGIAEARAQVQKAALPLANPGRPTVSSPATLTPVGYLQFENGVAFDDGASDFSTQFGVNQVTKLTVLPRFELQASFAPFDYSTGEAGSGSRATQPGGISAGVQVIMLSGAGLKPTLSLAYVRSLYGGTAPDTDVGSALQGVTFLWSEDFGRFHADINGVFNEQTQGDVRRAQFGQTLSVSHPIGSFVLAGELWHFTQPLINGNAVGNLWALSYAIRNNLIVDMAIDHGLTSTSTQWEGLAGFTYLLPHRLWKLRK